ncbi:MAG: protein kinase domain-containing protein [Gemmatimonadales bacterium]
MSIDSLRARLADRYRIERELGAGGMATVYLAEDLRHHRHVAIKILRPELAAVIGAERFLSEIKTTANLQHPHILPLHDSGEVNGTVFYVMPYVEGESLRDRLTRERQLPIDDALRIATEIASALDYAHRHGVIHRDIKPENILLHDGQALVADFGIALAASRTDGGTRLTETGMSLGTPTYMSPEQAMGERTIDARTDVYALGCVTYEMLTGEPPFTGLSAQAIVARVMTEQPRSLTSQRRTVSPALEAVVLRALEKLPADRYESAKAFAEALHNAGAEPASPRASPSTQPAAPSRRLRGLLPWALFGAAVVALAVVLMRRPKANGTEGDVVRATIDLPANANLERPYVMLSRDGGRLAVQGRIDGHDALLSRRLGDSSWMSIPLHIAGFPFLAPDGSWMVFLSDTTMRAMPLDGGPPLDLAEGTWGGGEWAANRQLIYTPDYTSGLWSIPARGGTPHRLTVPDTAHNELGHWWPQLLPDGDHVLFTAYRSPISKATLEVLSLKSGKRTVLVNAAVDGHYVSPGYLLYARNETVLAAPFDIGALRITGPPVAVVQDVAMEPASGLAAFGVSRNGTLAYITASSLSPPADLVWVDRTGKESTPLAAAGRYESPSIGPDGRRIAVTFSRPGETEDIWVLDLDRGTRTPLTTGGGADFDPLFTADGKRVIYVSERPVFDLYWRATDASSPAEPLWVSGFDKQPGSFTPDGKQLLVSYHLVPFHQIWSVPLDGSGKPHVVMASAEGSLDDPRVSPDGRWLAYASTASGRSEVYLSPWPEVSRSRTQVSVGGGAEPRWTRGGREVLYFEQDTMMTATVDPATGSPGKPAVLFHGDFVGGVDEFTYDVTPDGSKFLMVGLPPGSEPRRVVVVTNWFAELRRLMASAKAGQ